MNKIPIVFNFDNEKLLLKMNKKARKFIKKQLTHIGYQYSAILPDIKESNELVLLEKFFYENEDKLNCEKIADVGFECTCYKQDILWVLKVKLNKEEQNFIYIWFNKPVNSLTFFKLDELHNLVTGEGE